MTQLSRNLSLLLSAILMAACQSERVAAPPPDGAGLQPLAAGPMAIADESGGAIVRNAGEGKPDSFCYFAGGLYTTFQSTAVRTPSGNVKLSCQFDGLPEIAEQQTLKGWLCTITNGGFSQTHQSQWVRTPEGTAHLSCEFSGKPVNDAVVSLDNLTMTAEQSTSALNVSDLPGQRVAGQLATVGLACAPISTDLTGKVALIERGVCAFSVKLANALNAGAVAAIVYNSAAFGDQIIEMGGIQAIPLPSVFVGRSTGLALARTGGVVTITYCGRSASCRGSL